MALQEDQQALLQLLCERGQSYEDISGLLGVPTAEVQARARAALTEIGGRDPDAEVGLTDYLLAQADPIGRADAVRFLQGDPEALDLARTIQQGLSEIAPAAKQPSLPEPRGRRRRAALPESGESASGSRQSRPEGDIDGPGTSGRTRLVAGLIAGGIIVLFVALLITGAFSGSGDGSDADPSADPTAATDSTTGADPGTNITAVPLDPIAGSGVAGEATFGLVDNEQLYVDVEVQGLDPELENGRSYLVWLMVGDTTGYPIERLESDDNGAFSGRLVVPTPIAVAVGNQARSVRISATSVRDLQSEIAKAAENEIPVLPFVGTELASGDIPLVRGEGERPGNGGG